MMTSYSLFSSKELSSTRIAEMDAADTPSFDQDGDDASASVRHSWTS
jgi:hypothetical protein